MVREGGMCHLEMGLRGGLGLDGGCCRIGSGYC